MKEERLSGALQENILTALCFDDAHCTIIRAAITPQLFESAVYREIAGHAIDFIDQYKEAVKDHLPDHLENILNGDDKRKAESYRRLLDNLFLARDSTNGEYVVSQLQKFVRQQNLKAAFMRAVEAFEAGNVDEAEVALQKGLDTQLVTFSAGLNLSDANEVGALLENPEEEGFDLGIEELDERGIIPRRKEIMGLMAARGKGKSWGCTHVAKWALLQGWKPLVVTLEMSEKRYAIRFLQSFFSISKRDATVRLTRLSQEGGSYLQVVHEEIERMTLRDPDIKQKLTSKVRREFKKRQDLRIKAFPTGMLTIEQLEAYLDGLERFENYIPDLLIVDYPHLMKHDANNKRIDVGHIVERLRGICVARNMAGFIPTQGNRISEDAKLVTSGMTAEDISFWATVDTGLTYSQTKEEKKLGLARLFVQKCRNEEDGQCILITQAYSIGQFCLDSKLLDTEKYWAFMNGPSHDDDDEEDDREEERRERRPRSRGRK